MDSVQLGRRAELLQDNPVFEEALERVEEDIISEWRRAETTDEREQAYAELRGFERFTTKLDAIVADGEVDQHLRESE